jgi:hypothetical protein
MAPDKYNVIVELQARVLTGNERIDAENKLIDADWNYKHGEKHGFRRGFQDGFITGALIILCGLTIWQLFTP